MKGRFAAHSLHALLVLSFLFAASFPVNAQKAYVNKYSGQVTVFRANGTTESALVYTPLSYGELLVTEKGGSASLFMSSGLSVHVPEKSVISLFFSGPGTDPKPFFAIFSGSSVFSFSGRGEEAPRIRQGNEYRAISGERQTVSAPEISLDDISAQLEKCLVELAERETDYRRATDELESVTDEYRDLLASGNGERTQAFREQRLYPAQDARSAVIGEIRYQAAMALALRNFSLAPLYMDMKSRFPLPAARDGEATAFFARYREIAARYDTIAAGFDAQPFRYRSSNSSGETARP